MASAVVEDFLMTQAEHFSIHQEPVWRNRSNFIINAPLPEEGRFEQLWCRQVSSSSFELCCVPFFLYDVALGDIVETRGDAGQQYLMSRVVTPSGRYVFRVHFDRSMLQNRDEVVERLTEMGALLEWSSQSLLAVDARDAAHGQEIADFLFDRESKGQLIYETGRSESACLAGDGLAGVVAELCAFDEGGDGSCASG